MKVIIAGSRTIIQYDKVKEAILNSKYNISEVVSGTAIGVDRYGERFALLNNIPIKKFPANWDKYGKKAGIIRNEEMAKYADALIAVWNGTSSGTKHMIYIAEKYHLKTYISIVAS